MNYKNNRLCDLAIPLRPPATTSTIILRVIMFVGVAAAIVVAGILVKISEKKNSVIHEQHEKQQDTKI